MSYSDFTLRKAKADLGLTFVEGVPFLPTILPIAPSTFLAEFLDESIPLAIAMGSEKARSELIISPILFELRKQLDRKISIAKSASFLAKNSTLTPPQV